MTATAADDGGDDGCGGGACDVAIVGAGPAGSALAARLVSAGHSVELVEASRFDRPRIGESLQAQVRPLLAELGLWAEVLASEPVPSSGTRSRWGGSEIDADSPLFDPFGHGWQVDRRAFDQLLATGAAKRGAVLRCGARVVDADWAPDRGWRLAVEDGRPILARVLVDASGRSGRVARLLGAERLVFDRLVGVAGTFARSERAGPYVLVEACDAGWWYSAPLPGGGLITVLMTDADICRHQRLTDQERWASAATTEHTAARLPVGRPDRQLRSHAAFSSRTRRPSDDRPWFGVGDASLALDPLTGGGVAQALRDAVDAAAVVESLLDRSSDDPGRRSAIIAEREAKRDADCDAYLRQRLAVYETGPRLDSPFWARRHRVADEYRLTAGPRPQVTSV